MAENENAQGGEVEALREEVKNLASQVSTAVTRIHELEEEKRKRESAEQAEHETGERTERKLAKLSEREMSLEEEMHALRDEIKNMATAVSTAVERIRDLEQRK